MTKERTHEIEFIRSEIVGPARPLTSFDKKDIVIPDAQYRFAYPAELPGTGIPLFWRQLKDEPLQEIIHFRNETPLNRYGSGMLFPVGITESSFEHDGDINSVPAEVEDIQSEGVLAIATDDEQNVDLKDDYSEPAEGIDFEDDFDVTSPDMYHPSTLGVSFCLNDADGEFVISLPISKKFFWQSQTDEPIQLNGIYKKGEKIIIGDGKSNSIPAWLRFPATTQSSFVSVAIHELQSGKNFNAHYLFLRAPHLI